MSLFSFLNPKAKTIYVYNESSVVTDADAKLWCAAVELQIKRDAAPAWGKAAKKVTLKAPGKAPANSWVVVILDDADQAGALGYHSVDEKGRVYGRVFAKTAKEYGYSASQTFSHEVLETWGDPGVDQSAKNPKAQWSTPVELCDAVEGDEYIVNQVVVSNFLYPAWFGRKNGKIVPPIRYDHLGTAPAPFTLASNGYMVREWIDGHVDQVFGSLADAQYVAAKSHDMSRFFRRIH